MDSFANLGRYCNICATLVPSPGGYPQVTHKKFTSYPQETHRLFELPTGYPHVSRETLKLSTGWHSGCA